MPLNIISPRHSFVNFNDDLEDIILPAYDGIDIAFQFKFSPDAMIALTTPVKAGIAYTNGSIIWANYDVINVCAWGRFEEIDFDNDFPITIQSFPLTGYYNTPQDLFSKISEVYNISASGSSFMQCCSLEYLPEVLFTFKNAASVSKSAGINFYKGLQQVNLTGLFNELGVQINQCFKYAVVVGNNSAVSNTFHRVDNDMFLTRVTYNNNEDAYDFSYKPISNVRIVPATPPTGDPKPVTRVQSPSWNLNGAKIYAPGFPLTGLGTVISHLIIPHFWVNGEVVTERLDIMGNTTDGRMNANGIWVSNNTQPGTVWQPLNEWIGFSRKVANTISKTVYLGIAGDNFIKVKLNGVEILNTSGSTWNDLSTAINYQTWSIFPVFLQAGENYIEMSVMNFNVPGLIANPAGFACEIYDMTLQQLQNAKTEADLNIIFRTRDMVGQPFDIGTTIGYSCQDGWILIKNEDGSRSCIKIEESGTMKNDLYLPILAKKPRYPNHRKVYMKSDKQYKVQYAYLEKEWECKTEDLPDSMHGKIAVMLDHDNIHFKNHRIDSDIFKKEDDYAPDWSDDDTSETAIATFKVNTPFEGRNSNCEKRKVCTAAIQPVQCVAIVLDPSFVLLDATMGQPYSITQSILQGTPPYTLNPSIKPDWMSIELSGNSIVYSGTPLTSGAATVQIAVTNCDSTVNFSSNINTIDTSVTMTDVTGTINSLAHRISITINSPLPDDIVLYVDGSMDLGGSANPVRFTTTIPAGDTSANSDTSTGVINCINGNEGNKYLASLQVGTHQYNITLTINGAVC